MLKFVMINFKRFGFIFKLLLEIKFFKIISTFRSPSEIKERSLGVPLNKKILDHDLSKSGILSNRF